MLGPMLDAIPPLKAGRRGRPRRRPVTVHADTGDDSRRCREACVVRGTRHRIARRGIESTTHSGRHRWVVERTFADRSPCDAGQPVRLARYRRLTIRYERLVAMHRAFLRLGCALICLNYLRRL